jgi:hypothetical protein
MKCTVMLLAPPGAMAVLLLGTLIVRAPVCAGQWLALRHRLAHQAEQPARRPMPVGTSDDEGPTPCNVANPCGR